MSDCQSSPQFICLFPPHSVACPSSCLLTRLSVRHAMAPDSPLRSHLSDLATERKGHIGRKINSQERARPSHWAQLCPPQNQINKIKIKRKEGTKQDHSLIRAQLGSLKSISALTCWHSASGGWWSCFLCAHRIFFLCFNIFFKVQFVNQTHSKHHTLLRFLKAMLWIY